MDGHTGSPADRRAMITDQPGVACGRSVGDTYAWSRVLSPATTGLCSVSATTRRLRVVARSCRNAPGRTDGRTHSA